MSIWKQLVERMRGLARGEARTPPEGDVGMTYPDLERDKARKEAMLSGEGFVAGAGTAEKVPVATLARKMESVDVLELAGSTHVVQLPDMLGRSLARRALAGEVRANAIGRFGELMIAEAPPR